MCPTEEGVRGQLWPGGGERATAVGGGVYETTENTTRPGCGGEPVCVCVFVCVLLVCVHRIVSVCVCESVMLMYCVVFCVCVCACVRWLVHA